MKRTTLIIGASSDIGIAIAEKRAMMGDQLILHFHSNEESISSLAESLAPDQILQIVQADLSELSGIEYLLQSIVFHVDMIIYSSGKAEFGLFHETSEETMDVMLNLHVKAPWIITKHFLPSMIKNQFGKIIFITSIWGEIGASHEVLYSTVKGAQNSFIKSLAKEVGPSHIMVNGISPGFIDTKMNSSLTDDEKNEIYKTIPMQRPGYPFEVAEVVNFVLETNTYYLNGQIIPVTGGWMIDGSL